MGVNGGCWSRSWVGRLYSLTVSFLKWCPLLTPESSLPFLQCLALHCSKDKCHSNHDGVELRFTTLLFTSSEQDKSPQDLGGQVGPELHRMILNQAPGSRAMNQAQALIQGSKSSHLLIRSLPLDPLTFLLWTIKTSLACLPRLSPFLYFLLFKIPDKFLERGSFFFKV